MSAVRRDRRARPATGRRRAALVLAALAAAACAAPACAAPGGDERVLFARGAVTSGLEPGQSLSCESGDPLFAWQGEAIALQAPPGQAWAAFFLAVGRSSVTLPAADFAGFDTLEVELRGDGALDLGVLDRARALAEEEGPAVRVLLDGAWRTWDVPLDRFPDVDWAALVHPLSIRFRGADRGQWAELRAARYLVGPGAGRSAWVGAADGPPAQPAVMQSPALGDRWVPFGGGVLAAPVVAGRTIRLAWAADCATRQNLVHACPTGLGTAPCEGGSGRCDLSAEWRCDPPELLVRSGDAEWGAFFVRADDGAATLDLTRFASLRVRLRAPEGATSVTVGASWGPFDTQRVTVDAALGGDPRTVCVDVTAGGPELARSESPLTLAFRGPGVVAVGDAAWHTAPCDAGEEGP